MESGGWRRLGRGVAELLVLATLFALAVGLCRDGIAREGVPQAYIADDFELQNLPVHAFYGRGIAQGELRFWSPELGGGFPIYSEGEGGVLYPGNALFSLLPAKPWVAMTWTMILHLCWAGLGIYLHLRLLGCNRLAALCGGMAFIASGPVFVRAVHLHILQGICWLPWLTLGLEYGFRGRDRGYLGAALSVGMIGLVGHQHPLLLSGLLAATYLTGRCLAGWPGGSQRRALAATAGAFALGSLLCSALVLPLLEMIRASARSGTLSRGFRLSGSLEPVGSYSLLLPQWFGSPLTGGDAPLRRYGLAVAHEWCAFVGVLPLLALVAAPWIGRRRERWIFVAIALLGLALAMGKTLPFYNLLAHMPAWSQVRGPGRVLPLFAWGLAMLLGLCLHDRMTAEPVTGRPRLALMGTVVLAALLLAVWARFLIHTAGLVAPAWWPIAVAAAVGALVWVLPWRGRFGGVTGLAAIVVVALSGLTALNHYLPTRPVGYYDEPETAISFRETGLRLWAPAYCGAFQTARFLLFPGVQNVVVYSEVASARYARLRERLERGLTEGDLAGRRWLSLLRVTAFETTPNPVGGSARDRLRPTSVPPAPPFWLVDDWRVARSARDADQLTDDPTWLPNRLAILEREPGFKPGQGGSGAATLVYEGRHHACYVIENPAPTVLVTGQCWAPGWECRGRQATAQPIDGHLLGAVLPAGTGRVDVVYRPLTIRLGMWLSLCGLALLVGTWVVARHE